MSSSHQSTTMSLQQETNYCHKVVTKYLTYFPLSQIVSGKGSRCTHLDEDVATGESGDVHEVGARDDDGETRPPAQVTHTGGAPCQYGDGRPQLTTRPTRPVTETRTHT